MKPMWPPDHYHNGYLANIYLFKVETRERGVKYVQSYQ